MSTQKLEVIREPERRQTTKLSRIQWWRLEKLGKVPKRIQLGANSVGWLRHEIDEWITQRAAQRWPK